MAYPIPFQNFCETIELKFTSLRKLVLFILWNTKKAHKAYEILEEIGKINPNFKPSTVYRVLDYFVENGLVHKIDSIQSYTLCNEPKNRYPSELLLVCNSCHQVAELYDQSIHEVVYQLSQNIQFALSQETIVLRGLCLNCH